MALRSVVGSSRRIRGAGMGIVAAIVVTAAYSWAWSGAPAFDGDSPSYLEMARDFADGRIDRPHLRAPGYPLFLTASGEVDEPGARLVVTQVFLHCLCVALWLVLLRASRASRWACAMFVLVALSPPFVEHARFVLSEALAEVAVSAALAGIALFVLRGGRGWLLLSAAGVGGAGIVHPVHQLLWLLLPALLGLFRFASRGRLPSSRQVLASAILLAVAALGLFGTVMLRNQQRFGFASISPMLGATLSHKTSRVVELLPDDPAGVREILIRHRDAALLDPESQHLGHSYIFRALRELREATGLDAPGLDRELVRMNLELIRRAPMDYVDEVLRSQVWFWSPGVTDVAGFGSGVLKAAWNGLRSVVLVGFWGALLLLTGPALLYLAAPSDRLRPDPGARPLLETLLVCFLCVGTVFYTAAVSCALTAAVYRLRIPVDLAILAVVVLAPGLWGMLAAQLVGNRQASARLGEIPPPMTG